MDLSTRRLAATTSALAIVLALSVDAGAQEAGPFVLLPQVLVEDAAQTGDTDATQDGFIAEARERGPATTAETVLTTRVTREDLDARGVDDPDDIGRLDPGIGYNENNGSFNIRGLDGSRVLTTIDGIRVPFIDSGARSVSGGLSTFDFRSVSSLDIVKGADSSVFGGGALGGIVGIRTVNPEDFLEGDERLGGRSRVYYDSADDSWGGDQIIATRLGNTYVLARGGYRDGNEIENQGSVGGYGATRTEPNPLDYAEKSLLLKLRHHLGPDQVVGVTGEFFRRDDDISVRTIDPTSYQPGTAFNDDKDERQRISLNYELGPDAGLWLDGADAVVYWQRKTIDEDFRAQRITLPVGPYGRDYDRELTTFGANGSVLKTFSTGGLDHAVSLGGEIFGSRASQYAGGEDGCPLPFFPGPPMFNPCNFLERDQADTPEVEGTTLGVFLQDEIAVTDRFRLTPGIRFDYYEQNPQETSDFSDNPTFAGVPDSSSDSAVSPKLRAEWDVFESVTLYGQYAAGFRAPTATELYLSYGGPGTYLDIGNPDLEPETSDGFETGVLWGDDKLGGSVSGFYNRYENFLDSVAVDDPAAIGIDPALYPLGVTRTINRDEVEIYGAEVAARWQVSPFWHTAGSFGAYVGRDRETSDDLNSIPATKAILNVGYERATWGVDAFLTLAAARDEAENERSKTPSYQTLDLTAYWEPEATPGLKLTAGVFNLFDETYYDALDLPGDGANPTDGLQDKEFYTEPGRTFQASLSYEF